MIIEKIISAYKGARRMFERRARDLGNSREGCWVDPETEIIAREYEATLDRYRREHPNGISLYGEAGYRRKRGEQKS